MGVEIERKFLIRNDDWKNEVESMTVIKQGYLNTHPDRTVRIRIRDDKGILTIKGKSSGMTRQEFEYNIPYNEALELLKLCEPSIIEKQRYIVVVNKLKWEIDIFEGENKPLQIAEFELESEAQRIRLPD